MIKNKQDIMGKEKEANSRIRMQGSCTWVQRPPSVAWRRKSSMCGRFFRLTSRTLQYAK